MPDASDIETHLDRDTVSATATVSASPAEVFDFLRRPENHAALSGDHTVQGVRTGPDRLGDGDRFGMKMKLFGVPYSVTSKVVEFEQDRQIAWCHAGKHRWRWELEDAGDGRTTVTETFDLRTAAFPPSLRLLGFPKRHLDNVKGSVENLVRHLAGGGTAA